MPLEDDDGSRRSAVAAAGAFGGGFVPPSPPSHAVPHVTILELAVFLVQILFSVRRLRRVVFPIAASLTVMALPAWWLQFWMPYLLGRPVVMRLLGFGTTSILELFTMPPAVFGTLWGMQAVLSAGIRLFTLRALRGEQPSWHSFLDGIGLWIPALGAAIIYQIALGLGLATFVVPGIVLGARWSVCGQILVDKDSGLIEAFAQSYELTHKSQWCLMLYALLWLSAAALALYAKSLPVVVLLATIHALGAAYLYMRLNGETPTVDALDHFK